MEYRIDIKAFLYLTAITVYISAVILELTVLSAYSNFNIALKYIRYFCYMLVAIKIIIDLYDEKSIWRICVIAIIVALMIVNLRTNTYMFYLLMIIAAKDVNFRKIIRQTCLVQGSLMAVFISASQIGLVENFVFLQQERNRYSLGFIYTSVAPELFFFFMMSYIYLRKEKMRIYEFAIFELINYWLFTETDTRLTFYLSTIMLVYVFFMRYFWQNRTERIRKNKWLIVTPAACCIGAIALHVFYNPDNSRWAALNEFLNHRLALGRNALDNYGITLFGQNIRWMGHSKLSVLPEYNYVDSAYMQMLLECGIVFLILIIVLYIYMMYVAVNIRDFYLQTILLFTVILSITEPRLLQLAFNPFPLLAAAAWSLKKPEELNRKEPVTISQIKIRATRIKLKNRY